MSKGWNANKLKGNDAENRICFLINSMSDWKCIKFGVENHIKDLRNAVREHFNPITEKIKSMPDFVAFNEKTGETHFIEVKYRSEYINYDTGKQEYHLNYLKRYKEYWSGTKLVIFQKCEPYIFVINLDEINDSMLRKIKGKGSFWNFEGIKRDIKEVFPELNNEVVEKSIERLK